MYSLKCKNILQPTKVLIRFSKIERFVNNVETGVRIDNVQHVCKPGNENSGGGEVDFWLSLIWFSEHTHAHKFHKKGLFPEVD